MEIIGKFIKALPETTGAGQRGTWVRGGFVIETEEQFPRQVAFSLWGEDKVAAVRTMRMGTQIKVYFSPESREFNEKWYTELRCFRIDTFNPITAAGQGEPQGQFVNNTQSSTPQSQPLNNNSIPQTEEMGSFNNVEPQEDDDLPF